MNMKRTFVYLILFTVSLILASCSSADSNVNNQTTTSETGSTDKQTSVNADGSQEAVPSLKVYQLRAGRFGHRFLLGAASEYNDSHEDIQIKLVEFKEEQIDEYATKLTTEMYAGEGPDIIIFGKGYPFKSKFIENGALLDMEKLVQNDATLNSGQYNRIAMDKLLYNGKRYALPCAYRFPAIYSVPSAMEKSNLPVDGKGWSWNEFVSFSKKFAEKNEKDGKYLFNSGMKLIEFIKFSGYRFIDFDKRESGFNSLEFIKLLEDYKAIYPSICPEAVRIKYKGNYYQMLKEGIISVVYSDELSSIYELWGENSAVHEFLNEEIVMIPFPTYKDSGIAGIVHHIAGINANCKYPEDAFDFTKVLLSETMQNKTGDYVMGSNDSSSSYGMPILKSSYEHDKEVLMDIEKSTNKGLSGGFEGFESFEYAVRFNTVALPEKLVNTLEKSDKEIVDYRYTDDKIYDFIEEELPDFLSGKLSAKQMAEKVHSKVSLYINE